MKESITKFDLEAAFKALDELDVPTTQEGIRANKPALTEIFSRKSKFDTLFEEYYDIGNTADLSDAKEAREAEVAKAKLARIEKIVDLDAESPEDLLTSYVGKYIIQCPQCMTLFYKNPEDVEESEEEAGTVNVNEVCQHCGNESGYTLVGKVGAAEPDETELPEETSEEAAEEDTAEETTDGEAAEAESDDDLNLDALDLDADLEELDLEIEDDETEVKEESLETSKESLALTEQLTEDNSLEVSEDEFEDLINSPEFKKPISDSTVRVMMQELGENATPKELNDLTENAGAGFRIDATDLLDIEDLADAVYRDIDKKSIKQAVKKIKNTDISVDDLRIAAENSDYPREVKNLIAFMKAKNYKTIGDFSTSLDECLLEELYSMESTSALEEGIFDKIKDKFSNAVEKITDKVKSREDKANWILANAREDYENIKIDASGKLIPDEENRRFNKFIVIGFKEHYSTGKLITSAPSFSNKDLVIGMRRAEVKKTYQEADNIAKGWSMRQGNGPAFIYLAKDEKDTKAVFLCEYFNGELEYDQLEKYFNVVKKDLQAGKLMAQGGLNQAEDAEEGSIETGLPTTESLDSIMSNLEELKESVLEKLIADSLVEAYKNVAGFRLAECSYLNEEFTVHGTIYFTSGNTRKTSYVFSEAFTDHDNKINLRGLNEKLGLDKQFTLVGSADKDTKTFIAESFTYNTK